MSSLNFSVQYRQQQVKKAASPIIQQAAEVTEQRALEAVTERITSEIENKQYANSFLGLKVPSVPPDPPIRTLEWNGVVKVEKQPPWGKKPGIGNNCHGAMGWDRQCEGYPATRPNNKHWILNVQSTRHQIEIDAEGSLRTSSKDAESTSSKGATKDGGAKLYHQRVY